MTYDPRSPDAYTSHLGAVSEIRTCVAGQDIHNEFGVLLVKKGDPISAKLAAKLTEHTLEQDIDEAITLEGVLSGEELLAAFQALYTKYADLDAIQNQRGAQGVLDSLCLRQAFPAKLMQKLSVLQLQFPAQFEQSILGAWIAALIALTLQWSSERIYAVFCSALFRDIGLLHIDECVAKNAGSNEKGLTNEQLRALAAHPLLAKRIVSDCNKYSDEMSQAIAEHHEHPAGIGYPSGRTCHAMSEMGNVLALSELLCQRCCIDSNSFSGAASYLHAASSIYKVPMYSVVYQLLKSTEFSGTQETIDSEKSAEKSISRMISIGGVFSFLVMLQQQLTRVIDEISGDKMVNNFSARVDQAIMLLHSTGLDSTDLIGLLDELKTDSAACELEDTEIVQKEFLHVSEHIFRLGAKWLAKETRLSSQLKSDLVSSLKSIKSILNEVR